MRAFLWPRTIKTETTIGVRFGRVLHWCCATIAALIAVGTAVFHPLELMRRSEYREQQVALAGEYEVYDALGNLVVTNIPDALRWDEIWGPFALAAAFALLFLLFGRALRYILAGE